VLLDRGLNSARVVRVFSAAKAVVGFALSESGIGGDNVFSGVYVDRSVASAERLPFMNDEIRLIQDRCYELNDDLRWLIALISDTGLRLAEAAGLVKADIILDADVPHVVIRPHPWRSLKTTASERSVPLIGASLWAARRVLAAVADDHAFPRYADARQTNANSASATLNKWLKQVVPRPIVVHSFRHSMRDRLRAVECPKDIADVIGGWRTAGEGQTYGQGYPLATVQKWMLRLAL
jgi:integrase